MKSRLLNDALRGLALSWLFASLAGFAVAGEPKSRPQKFAFENSGIGTNKQGDRRATSPDGKVRVELSDCGDSASLVDVAGSKAFGRRLDPGRSTFTCCAFSPDGKYVVTGSRFDDTKDSDDGPTHVGRLEIWDAATGKQVAAHDSGPVSRCKFKADGRTIIYDDESPESGGK